MLDPDRNDREEELVMAYGAEIDDRSALGVLMDAAEVSAYLGVPTGTLANWRYQGRGPAFIRIGRHVRYRPEDVRAWLASRTAGGELGGSA